MSKLSVNLNLNAMNLNLKAGGCLPVQGPPSGPMKPCLQIQDCTLRPTPSGLVSVLRGHGVQVSTPENIVYESGGQATMIFKVSSLCRKM